MSVTSVVANPAVRWKVERAFFLCMGLAILGENVVGFTRSFLKTDQAQELQSDWVKVHALAFAGWLLLFVLQSALIASNRVKIHRRVGVFGVALVTVMIGLTIGSGVTRFVHSPPRPFIEHFMLDVTVHVDVFIFAGFAIAGILLRGKPETHKRLMLLATIAVGLRWPPLAARLLLGVSLPHFCEQIAYVLVAILFDHFVRGRVNRVLLWGLVVFLVVPAGVDWIFQATVPQLVVHPIF